MNTMWIPLQHRLRQQHQAVEAAAHVAVPDRNPHSHPAEEISAPVSQTGATPLEDAIRRYAAQGSDVPRGRRLTPHLRWLEAVSIEILREVAAEFRKPVMLYSIGKDSGVMLHLARKAFYPARLPFPLLHVDTTWKFRDMIAFRDLIARALGLELLIHVNRESIARGINPITSGSALHTQVMKTEALKQALDAHGFDAALGGARRDEEKSRAKERILSFRSQGHVWDPRNQRPELWNLYNTRIRQGESVRAFPLSDWTEFDLWSYIAAEEIPVVPLYFSKRRPIVRRSGVLIMVDDERLPLDQGEEPAMMAVRFRTLGCYPLSGAIESPASDAYQILDEMLNSRRSEQKVDANTLHKRPARMLAVNEIGFCNLSTASPVAFDPYGENRRTGAFVLVDRFTHATAGAGMIAFGLRRATNIHHHSHLVDKRARAQLAHQAPCVLWFTGLPGSGKSTIANLVEKELHARGVLTMLLDGDNLRHGLNRDLGFTEADRVENVRRVGEVTKLFTEAGLVVLTCLISPFAAEREMVKELIGAEEFIEIFVDVPLEECIRRDPKGLYAKALKGGIENFTGIDSPYEAPAAPDIRIDGVKETPKQAATRILAWFSTYQARRL